MAALVDRWNGAGPMVQMGMDDDDGRGCAILDLQAFLAGGWTIVRTIRDRRAGLTGRFLGAAHFEPEGGGLAYRESGRLAIGTHAGPAEQAYFYTFPAPGRAEVRFRDGRPFHAIDLTAGWADAVHDCGSDRYRGRFRVLDADTWCAVWRIKGPRKDQTIASRFIRASGLTGVGEVNT